MSNFICPQCRHSSEFDEWETSAVCPNCGYEPPQGEEKGQVLTEQGGESVESMASMAGPDRQNSLAARFLPSSGQSFITGLGWGVLVFAIIMLLSSRMAWSGSVARCLGIGLPVLTTFIVWRLYAQREQSS